MPRKKLIRTDEQVYHVTTRSNSKEWFSIPVKECWKIFTAELNFVHQKYEVEFHAFVLMSNHYHLMLRTPQSNIDQVMYSINKNMALKINMSTGKINHVFGAPYKWSLITSQRYYYYATKYLYQNPVRARMCENVEDYPYSSLNTSTYDFVVSPYEEYQLSRLNQLFNNKNSDRIRKGFKRSYFKPSYESKSRRNEVIM